MAGQSISKSWQIIRKGFRYSYDYLGMVIASSALWFVTGFFPILIVTSFNKYIQSPIAYGVAVLVTLIVLGPSTAAVHGIAAAILDNEDTRVREFFKFFRKYFWRSTALMLLNVLILLILASDLIFTLNNPNRFIQMLSGIWVYFFIFWALMSNYIFPFVVNQDVGVLLTMKRSALLALDNLVVTIILSLAVLIVVVLSVVLAAPVLLLMLGIIAFLQNVGYRELMQKYDEAPTQTTADEPADQEQI